MLLLLHNSGKFYWVSQVHQVLYKFSFGFVWENQGVQNLETFIKAFKQRFIDCHSQNWHAVSAIVPDLPSIGCLKSPFP